jgi:hypothetical protein
LLAFAPKGTEEVTVPQILGKGWLGYSHLCPFLRYFQRPHWSNRFTGDWEAELVSRAPEKLHIHILAVIVQPKGEDFRVREIGGWDRLRN